VLTQEQGVKFMEGMNAAWNARDKDAWMSFFAPDFAEEMPANTPATKSPETLHKAWEDAFGPGGPGWKLEALQVVVAGNEIAVVGRYPGSIDGQEIEMRSIEIWTVGDDLKAHYCRAFFDPTTAPS